MHTLIGLWLGWGALAHAQDLEDFEEAERAPVEVSVPTLDVVFPSGFRLVVLPDPTQPVVGAKMFIDAGSAEDPPEWPGLAHLVEHVWFRSRHGTRPPVAPFLDAAGCAHNAHTEQDTVIYDTVCPDHADAWLLQLEAWRLLEPMANVTEEDVAAEARIVQAEARLRGFRDDGFWAVLDRAMLGEDHAYGHKPIGDPERLADARLADLQAFVDRTYLPGRTTLVVSGRIATDKVLRVLLRLLGPTIVGPDFDAAKVTTWRGAVAVRDVPWPEDPANPGAPLPLSPPVDRRVGPWTPRPGGAGMQRLLTTDDVDDMAVAAWSLPPLDPYDEGFGLSHLATVAEVASRDVLKRRGVDQRPYCHATGYRLETRLVCYLRTETAKADKYTTWLASSLATANPPTVRRGDARLRDVNNKVALLQAIEPVAEISTGRLNVFGRHAHAGYDTPVLLARLHFAQTSSSEVAFDWAQRHARPERAHRFYVVSTADQTLERREPSGEHLLLSNPGDVGAMPTRMGLVDELVRAEDLATATLPNGLRILAVRMGSMPTVRATLSTPPIPDVAPGVDLYAESLAREVGWTFGRWWAGRGNRTRSGLANEVGPVARQLAMHLEPAAPAGVRGKELIARTIRARKRFEERWGEGYLDLQRLPNEAGSLFSMPKVDLERLRALKMTQIQDYLAAKHRPERSVLVIVGAIDPEAAVAIGASAFRQWKVPRVPALEVPMAHPAPPVGTRVLLYDRPDQLHAEVSTRCVGDVEPMLGDRIASVAAGVLRTGIRPMRETAGLSYAPSVRAWGDGDDLEISLSIDVPPDEVAVALGVELAALDAVAHGEVGDDVWADIRARVMRSSALGVRSQRAIISDLLGTWRYGEDLEVWRHATRRWTAIQPDLVSAAVAQCATSRLVEVTGPVARTEKALKAAGIEVTKRFGTDR